MQTALSGLRVQPARCVSSQRCRAQRVAICCAAQRQQQQAAVPEPSAAPALALSSLLLGAAPAWADEAADAAAAAAADTSFAPFGGTPAGWALTLSPVIFYLLFNVYRSQIDPKAKFGDAVFIFAALLILANIVCITVFHVRIW